MRTINDILGLALAIALLAVPAVAQQADKPGAMPDMAAHPAKGAADNDLMSGMTTMNQAMTAAPMTGDADRDFVAMMLAHHQGAVDMAQTELKHGKDPAMRRMAHDIVAAQKKEIAEMQRWQARHPGS